MMKHQLLANRYIDYSDHSAVWLHGRLLLPSFNHGRNRYSVDSVDVWRSCPSWGHRLTEGGHAGAGGSR